MISTVANDITEIDEEELSPIAKYFIDLIRKERGY